MELPRRVFAWYGDDFTGSTDVLEVLASRGLPAVLFLQQPDQDSFQRFSSYRAFGLAGSSRSQSPSWMDHNLPPAFEWLRSLGAAICHYKVCSTLDSSPQVGSIGRALEIGQRVFETSYVPLVAGTPALRRYLVFGNLFAAAGAATFRIDRHPTMSRHPVTPMDEADIRLHLGRQTNRRIELMDLLDLNAPDAEQRLAVKLAGRPGVVLFDGFDERSELSLGRLLWHPALRQAFVVGSSGVAYALTAYWREQGLLETAPGSRPPGEAGRLVVLSGSCSPVTELQIAHAGHNGFGLVRLAVQALASGDGREAAVAAAVEDALRVLREGHNVVLYTAAGPADGLPLGGAQEQLSLRQALGEQAGRILCSIVDASRVRRVLIAGGDTSSHAAQQLGIEALTFVCPLSPGAPLCRAWSRDAKRDGIEIVLKGGQMGPEEFFTTVLECGPRTELPTI
jgi:3-oxoisoapionate kinase